MLASPSKQPHLILFAFMDLQWSHIQSSEEPLRWKYSSSDKCKQSLWCQVWHCSHITAFSSTLSVTSMAHSGHVTFSWISVIAGIIGCVWAIESGLLRSTLGFGWTTLTLGWEEKMGFIGGWIKEVLKPLLDLVNTLFEGILHLGSVIPKLSFIL